MMVAAVVVFYFFKSKSKRKKLSFFILGELVSTAVTQKHTSESCRGLFLIKKKKHPLNLLDSFMRTH